MRDDAYRIPATSQICCITAISRPSFAYDVECWQPRLRLNLPGIIHACLTGTGVPYRARARMPRLDGGNPRYSLAPALPGAWGLPHGWRCHGGILFPASWPALWLAGIRSMTGAAKRARAPLVLIAGADKEAGALDSLYRSEAPRLQRYFRQKTGDGDAASDLVQDTFVKMVSAYDSGLGNPAAYLQRIARNLVFDRFRGAKRTTLVAPMPLDECDASIPPAQEEEMAARDLLRLYEMAVEGLSDKTRAVYLLSRVEGLSYDGIRRRLGISMGTVEYHMMRAIAHIDRVLEER